MPTATCPACGREFPFEEWFHGAEVACPAAGCFQRILLPYADGTLPVPAPPTPSKPEPAATYYLRKPDDPELVVGPLPRERLRQLATKKKLHPTDEISADRRRWQAASLRDPGLFVAGKGVCRSCGALVTDDRDECPACLGQDDAERAGAAGGAAGPELPARVSATRVERQFTAPRPLVEFAAARSADALVGVGRDGWLGLWTTRDDQPAKTWELDPGPYVHLAVADRGGRAVVAVGDSRSTCLYVAHFDDHRARDVLEIDGPVHALALDADGRYLGLVDDGPDVRLYRVEPWKRVDRFPVRGTKFEFGLAADRLAAADRHGGVFFYDLRTGRVVRELLDPRQHQACPQMPLRMAFSQTGDRFFAAAGTIGQPGPEKQTALRVWDVSNGELVANCGDVSQHHPTGLADAFLWPWGSAAATVGETTAHAFNLTSGYLGPVYEVTDRGESERARAARRGGGSLIRQIDFTPDGEHALVLVAGDSNIRMVPWPVPEAEVLDADSESRK